MWATSGPPSACGISPTLGHFRANSVERRTGAHGLRCARRRRALVYDGGCGRTPMFTTLAPGMACVRSGLWGALRCRKTRTAGPGLWCLHSQRHTCKPLRKLFWGWTQLVLHFRFVGRWMAVLAGRGPCVSARVAMLASPRRRCCIHGPRGQCGGAPSQGGVKFVACLSPIERRRVSGRVRTRRSRIVEPRHEVGTRSSRRPSLTRTQAHHPVGSQGQ